MWTAFVIGFLGSLHCAAMCGPLMLGLGTKNYSFLAFMVHHIGRWIAYILLGFLFYSVVSPLYIFEAQQYIALVSGVLLLVYGLKSYIKPVDKAFQWITQKISLQMQNMHTSRTGNIGLGFLNGLLPCGLSFSTAILAVNTGSYLNVAAFMLLFGLGTLPMLLAISYLPRLGRNSWVQTINSWVPRMMVLVGFLLILRSAGLGIPYVSPKYHTETQKMECCEAVESDINNK